MNRFVVISPREFKSSFLRVVKQKETEEGFLNCWSDRRAYNAFFLSYDGILDEVCRGLKRNLTYHREYWYVDAILYASKVSPKHTGGFTYANYLAAAIESENDFSKSWQEMNKLCQFHSPLSVLITYPDSKTKYALRNFAAICRKADVFNLFSSRLKKVIVYGAPTRGGEIEWTFYKYTEGKFVLY